ncbi:MAG: HEAT repeat domain-containing protein [Planctomycetota bacterium]
MVAATALLLLLLQPDRTEVDFGTSASRRVKLLRHENPGVRRRAAMLLAHAKADEAIAGLLVALVDVHSGVREAAALSLGILGDERAVPFLARRVREEGSVRVLTAMLGALARCGGAYVARHVTPFLEHPARSVRAAAAAGLGNLGDAGQRDALWAALRFAPDDPGFAVRAAVLGAFVRLGWNEDVRRAVVELEEAGALRHWRSRTAIIFAIGASGMRERADTLKEELKASEDPRVVAAAAAALAHLGFLDEVFASLEHPSPKVRRAALVALQEAGDPRGVERALILVRDDPDLNVRFEALLVLDEATHPDADLYLVDALRARDPLYWITALSSLEKRHGRSFGRDPEAWTRYLKESRR